MNLEESQDKFLNLMREIKSEKERIHFLKWICTNWDLENLKEEDNDDSTSKDVLNAIAEELRSLVPFESTLPNENIKTPLCGPNADCDPKTVIHVDEFLYDDDYLDELVEAGKFSRYYCDKCYSKDVKPLTLISHSVSIERVYFIFRCLLHPLENEVILDVGSRLGPIVFGAYLYTKSPRIVGVEINSEFAKLQSAITKKYKFDDRIQIICNNICNELDLLSSVDVVILNNVFEFFTDYDTAVTSWHILANTIKPGCRIVTIPYLEDTFEHFKVDFDWTEWVEELKPHRQDLIADEESLENHLKCVKHYKVKKRIDNFNKK